MIGQSRRARGVSRFAVLLIVIGVAALLGWLWSRQGAAELQGSAASSGEAPSPGAKPAQPAAVPPASAASGQEDTAGAAVNSAVVPDSRSSGVNLTTEPAQAAANPAAIAQPRAGSSSAGAEDDDAGFPRDWRRCFLHPGARDEYLIESDSSTAWSGSRSVRIASRTDKPRFPGAGLCQVIAAATLQGRRVRMTLHMRTQGAVPGAHMLFRAEAADGRLLAFYNMEPRFVSGTRDWAEYSAVLDVPVQATVVVFGGTLVGAGTLWIDDALLEFVGRDVAVTPGPPPGVHFNPVIDASILPKALQNPGFEQLAGSPAS